MQLLNNLFNVFRTLFDEGGWVLYPIFGVSVLALYVGFSKLIYLRKLSELSKIINKVEIQNIKSVRTGFAPFDTFIDTIKRSRNISSLSVEYAFGEFLATVVPDLEHGFSTMATCVSAAPLLGLLGTISGMNRMFSVITDVGIGNPGLMAGGISIALESALTGLAVAVVSMFFHNYLFNKKNYCLNRLIINGEQIVKIVAINSI
jgi:biopolymer transport protein ExbB